MHQLKCDVMLRWKHELYLFYEKSYYFGQTWLKSCMILPSQFFMKSITNTPQSKLVNKNWLEKEPKQVSNRYLLI